MLSLLAGQFRKTSSVDWPNGWAGRNGPTGESLRRRAHPGTGTRPRAACSTYWIMPRWIRCSSLSTSRIDSTGAHGTPAACRSRTRSARVRVLVTGEHLVVDRINVGGLLSVRNLGVIDQLGPAQRGRHSAPVALGDANDRQPAVARLINVVRRNRHPRVPVTRSSAAPDGDHQLADYDATLGRWCRASTPRRSGPAPCVRAETGPH